VKRSPSLPDPDNGVMPERLDDVDRIVRAWSAERPDVDARPLEVLSRVTRISKHLDRLRRAVFSVHGLDVWEFDVLATLRRAGKPYQLTPTALMAQTLVTSGAMTNRINRLEARGLVSRQADLEDGRRVVVGLSEPGRKLVDRALDDLLAAEQRALEPLTPAQRTELASLLRSVSLHIEAPSD
jgi:DNA-binding MarR family transcriptional regulator